jgi:hypothetical protein
MRTTKSIKINSIGSPWVDPAQQALGPIRNVAVTTDHRELGNDSGGSCHHGWVYNLWFDRAERIIKSTVQINHCLKSPPSKSSHLIPSTTFRKTKPPNSEHDVLQRHLCRRHRLCFARLCHHRYILPSYNLSLCSYSDHHSLLRHRLR